MLAVLAGWHGYLWARLVRDPGWPPPVRKALTAMLVVLALAPLAMRIGRRYLADGGPGPAVQATNLWWGVGFLLLMAVLLTDIGRLLAHAWQRLASDAAAVVPPVDPERRQMLARTVAVGSTAVAAAAGGWGIRAALGDVTTPEISVRLARLPKTLDGLTIVQLTDVHIGSSLARPFLEGVVEKVNALKPDVVVLTGDLVDGSVARLRSDTEPFGAIKARWGVFSCTGNHEFYSGATAWIEELERLGIRTLGNAHVTVGDAGGAFDLAGVHDFAGGVGPAAGALALDLDKALAGRTRPDNELVLLAHQPKAISLAAAAQDEAVGLMLSGHTHGGQIQPFGALVRLAQPYVSGLHPHGPTRTQTYVSRGTGVWGPPMRIGAPAEISKIVLSAG